MTWPRRVFGLRQLSPARGALPLIGLLVGLAGVVGCQDESLLPPRPEAPLFRRYVALGNSITAGFQSGGIDDSTQMESYAVQLARAMGLDVGGDFIVPSLAPPGCPPPLVNVFTGERLGGEGPTDCHLRENIPPFISNLAVPGAATEDLLSNVKEASRPNPLTTLILGGRTQLDAAAALDPTFVSVWIGNNDVLAAALQGDTTLATPVPEFVARYGEVADRIAGMKVDGAVLIGVADVTAVPALSPGSAYWEAAQTPGTFPSDFTVADDCAPADSGGAGDGTLVPFDYAFGDLIAAAKAGTPATLDCVADARLLTAPEVAALQAHVSAFNQAIRDAASAHGWAYYDPNPELRSFRQSGAVPVFPYTQGADAVTRPFGDLFSRDGVHPSGEAHRMLEEEIAQAIDATYGTKLGDFTSPLQGSPSR